jgi:hypothetical protein
MLLISPGKSLHLCWNSDPGDETERIILKFSLTVLKFEKYYEFYVYFNSIYFSNQATPNFHSSTKPNDFYSLLNQDWKFLPVLNTCMRRPCLNISIHTIGLGGQSSLLPNFSHIRKSCTLQQNSEGIRTKCSSDRQNV